MVIVTGHTRTPSDNDADDVDDDYEDSDEHRYPPMVIVTRQTRTPSDEKVIVIMILSKSFMTTNSKRYISKQFDITLHGCFLLQREK